MLLEDDGNARKAFDPVRQVATEFRVVLSIESKAWKVPQPRPPLPLAPFHDQNPAAAPYHDGGLAAVLHRGPSLGLGNLRHPRLDPSTAERSHRAIAAARVAGRTERRAQLHERLVESPGAPRRQHGLGHRPQQAETLGRGGVAPVGQKPAEQPHRVGFQDRLVRVKGNGKDCPGRVAANAGQAAHGVRRPRKDRCVLGDDSLRCLVKLPCAAVVAQPLPYP